MRLSNKAIPFVLALHGSMTLDAWSTRRTLSRDPEAEEGNPLMRSLIRSPMVYAVANASLIPLDLLLMKEPKHKFTRLIGAVAALVHTAAAIHNLTGKPGKELYPTQPVRAG